jgi:flagellar biosynthetic protein FliR/FlhB
MMQTNFILFFIVSIRVVAMLISSPVFSMRQIPALVKVGLSLIMGYMMTSTMTAANYVMPTSNIDFIVVCSKELLIGLAIGFIATLIFNTVRASAQLMDFSIGFSMSQYYDPSTSSSSTVLERLFNWIALILFLTFNFHHVLIEAIIKSFEIIPPGVMTMDSNVFTHLVSVFTHSFLISIQLAAPIVIVLFLTDFTLGLISRAVPQIHIFILGMPIKVLVGLLAITIILPGLTRIYVKTFEGISGDILKFFNMFPVLFLFANPDKTEDPTSKKLSDAKKKGQIPKSVELNSAIILLFVMIIFNIYGDSLYTNGRLFIIESFK